MPEYASHLRFMTHSAAVAHGWRVRLGNGGRRRHGVVVACSSPSPPCRVQHRRGLRRTRRSRSRAASTSRWCSTPPGRSSRQRGRDRAGCGRAFLDALSNTNSTARVTQFGTVSAQLAPRTVVDDATLGPAVRWPPPSTAITTRSHPDRPPHVPSTTAATRSPQSFRSATRTATSTPTGTRPSTRRGPAPHRSSCSSSPTATRRRSTSTSPVTRSHPAAGRRLGTPTRREARHSTPRPGGRGGQPDQGRRHPDAGRRCRRGAEQRRQRATVSSPVAGPQVVRDADLAEIDSLNDVDVALVTEFDDLAAVPAQRRAPAVLTVADDPQAGPVRDRRRPTSRPPGGTMTVTPTVPGGTASTGSCPTPPPADVQDRSTPTPTASPSSSGSPTRPTRTRTPRCRKPCDRTTPPGDPGTTNDFRCELQGRGRRRPGGGGRADASPAASPSFALDPIGRRSSPARSGTRSTTSPRSPSRKINIPTAVRGDLTPPATVTSTTPSRTPATRRSRTSDVVDDKCAPVTAGADRGGFNVGDTNAQRQLDVPEAWQFTCTRPARCRGSAATRRQTVVNTVDVDRHRPAGHDRRRRPTPTTSTCTPRHRARPSSSTANREVTIPRVATVTYTYAVTNTGNTPLGTVTLIDDTPPCESPDARTRATRHHPAARADVELHRAPSPDADDVVNTATVTGDAARTRRPQRAVPPGSTRR